MDLNFIPGCFECGSNEPHDYSHSAERQAEDDDQFVKDVRAAMSPPRGVVVTTVHDPVMVINRLLQILERAGY